MCVHEYLIPASGTTPATRTFARTKNPEQNTRFGQRFFFVWRKFCRIYIHICVYMRIYIYTGRFQSTETQPQKHRLQNRSRGCRKTGRKPKENDQTPRKPSETQGACPNLRVTCINALTVLAGAPRWREERLQVLPTSVAEARKVLRETDGRKQCSGPIMNLTWPGEVAA